jgi:hypothetical protein
LASTCLASGPKYTYKDPKVNDEIQNIYHDIRAIGKSPNVLGVTDGSDACAGCVGEYIQSVVGSVSAPNTTEFKDITSITLTAGDWDVSLLTYSVWNSAVQTAFSVGISTVTGNSGAGLSSAANYVESVGPIGTGTAYSAISISGYRKSVTGTTILYGKLRITYGSGTPALGAARLSARRVR